MNNLRLFALLLSGLLLLTACQKENEIKEEPKEPIPTKPEEPEEPEPTIPTATLSPLHVEGAFLVNGEGKRVNMHGFAQTFSPWFNEQGTKWTDFDVAGCLSYNKGIIDAILSAGWKMDFVRHHMDPHWSNGKLPDGVYYVGEDNIQYFKFDLFKKYLDEVFVPMAEYAISKGLYVVMRPPGVCPQQISVGGEYHQYLKKVWDYVAQHPKLKNNGAVLFELANEPINIIGTRGDDIEITDFMQQIVDVIRQHCDNVLLIPGLGYQSRYAGFAKYPVQGTNIGYAVHCYPGFFNSGHHEDVNVAYKEFKRGWEDQIAPIADKAPIVVTEMDWGPKIYSPSHKNEKGEEVFDVRCSFGFANTGTAGGQGFGANFKKITDETCNVSWLLFTGGELLAKYNDSAPDGTTFLTDPEACPRPCFRWFKEYATKAYSDMINDPNYGYHYEEQPLFSLTERWFNPSIYASGTFNEKTGELHTGQWGFGGWQYSQGVDLSGYKKLTVELSQSQNAGASFRLFDSNNYWSSPSRTSFGSNTKIVIDLHNLKAYKDDACTEYDHDIDPSHIFIAGFWTTGSSPIYIKSVTLSKD